MSANAAQLDLLRDRPPDEIGARELPNAPEVAKKVWAVLWYRVGRDRAIKSPLIEAVLGVTGPEVRFAINWLRSRAHKPILSGSAGYWIGVDQEEILNWCESMRGRCVSGLFAMSGVRRMAFSEVGDQVVLGLRRLEEEVDQKPETKGEGDEHDDSCGKGVR